MRVWLEVKSTPTAHLSLWKHLSCGKGRTPPPRHGVESSARVSTGVWCGVLRISCGRPKVVHERFHAGDDVAEEDTSERDGESGEGGECPPNERPELLIVRPACFGWLRRMARQRSGCSELRIVDSLIILACEACESFGDASRSGACERMH